ncbi:MAG: DUF3373 domain-containing protein [bacterium]|nr:DUF3373 domain-containing protein [bacterium]
MALFNRKKNDTTLPEVEKYYEAEKRDRAGAGWLLALISVLTIALIIVGLFLAGRWAYNKVTDDNGDVATTDNNQGNPNFDGEGGQNSGTTDGNSNTDEANTDEDSEAANDEEIDGSVDAPARTDTPNSVDESGKASGDLPNTGPADTMAVFAASTVAGTLVHNALQRRKNN